MRIIFLFINVFISVVTIHAQVAEEPVKPNTYVQQYADEIMEKASLKRAAFSFYVKDMNSGAVVAQFNENMAIPSASTMKLVTTATATQFLGRGYVFKTKLMYTGSLDTTSGILHGDLYIIGGGDPTLGSRYYNDEGHERDFLYQWAEEIKAAGIKEVDGRIIADGSKYNYDGVPSGWVWGDLGNYYGAGPAGLTIFDNMCKLHFSTPTTAGQQTELTCITPYIPGLEVENRVKSADSKSDNAYVYGAPFSLDWFVEGSIPKNREDFTVKASIPDPEFVVAIEFDQVLGESGVHVCYAPTTRRQLNKNIPFETPKMTLIHEHQSPSLASIMNWVNKKSVNLFAEHVLCEISYKQSGYGSTHNGAQYCMNYWQNKIGNGLFMTDGSGLSRSNAVSASFLVRLLTYMHKTKAGESFKSSLAVAGKSGTMAGMGRGTSAAGRVYGKSGTMTRIKSYAGYVDTQNGKKLAYAMIINNHSCSNAQIKKYFQFLMVKMARY